MAVKIELKRSAVPGKVPTTGSLDLGELALNTYDGRAFMKQQQGTTQSIIEFATTAGSGSGVISSSYALSASYAVTSSYPLQGIVTASAVNTTIIFTRGDQSTFNVTVSQSGSVATASYALYAVAASTAYSSSYSLSGSYSNTSSFALSTISSSYALTASYINPLEQNVILTGSILFNGGPSLIPNGSNIDLIAGPGGWSELASNDGNQYIWVDNGGAYIGTNWTTSSYSWYFDTSGNLHAPGTITTAASITASAGFLGNLTGTASFAQTASYVLEAMSASYSLTSSFAQTASFVNTAQTASYVVYAETSSHADSFTIGGSLIKYSLVPSTIAGNNGIFATNTGSFSSAFYQYTVFKGENARSNNTIAVWTPTTQSFTNYSTIDIGSTVGVEASVVFVGNQVQLNLQTPTPGWTVKAMVTFL